MLSAAHTVSHIHTHDFRLISVNTSVFHTKYYVVYGIFYPQSTLKPFILYLAAFRANAFIRLAYIYLPIKRHWWCNLPLFRKFGAVSTINAKLRSRMQMLLLLLLSLELKLYSFQCERQKNIMFICSTFFNVTAVLPHGTTDANR